MLGARETLNSCKIMYVPDSQTPCSQGYHPRPTTVEESRLQCPCSTKTNQLLFMTDPAVYIRWHNQNVVQTTILSFSCLFIAAPFFTSSLETCRTTVFKSIFRVQYFYDAKAPAATSSKPEPTYQQMFQFDKTNAAPKSRKEPINSRIQGKNTDRPAFSLPSLVALLQPQYPTFDPCDDWCTLIIETNGHSAEFKKFPFGPANPPE